MLLKQFLVFKKPFQRPLGYRSILYNFIVVFIVRFFSILTIHKHFLGLCEVPQNNADPIGSAILTFIGYKQTNKPRYTNRQAKYNTEIFELHKSTPQTPIFYSPFLFANAT